MPQAALATTVELDRPIDLALTLGPLRHGRGDRTMAFTTGGVWRATRTPEGPVTVHLRTGPSADVVHVQAWGPGAAWVLAVAGDVVGAGDSLAGFSPAHPAVARAHRRSPGLRITRTRAVFEALVPAVIEQKVTGLEARRSYAALLRAHGSPAPGPGRGSLVLPPSPERLAALPYHAFHRFGLERRRADVLRRAGALAGRLEEAVLLPPAEALRRLQAVPGVGGWTAAEVARVALGDADAVSVGDYHLPHRVAWALAGERRADDERMLALLEPYRGHRGRVQRLVEVGTAGPPRRAPRLAPRSITRI